MASLSSPPSGVRGRLRGEVPKAAAKITDDVGELLAFYNYPTEHWVQLRTTNPIEPTFATVRHRTKVTKGPVAQNLKLLHKVLSRGTVT
jgi:transposase-like protein